MRGSEGSLQTYALKWLNSLSGCCAENVSGNARQSGRPDINGCYRGQAFKIELKTPDDKNTASKKQQLELRRWKNAGCVVAVIYSVEALKQMFYQDWHEFTGVCTITEENGCESWFEVPNKW